MKNKTKKVWQARPTLIEHLRRVDMTLKDWVEKNDITDEAKLNEVCKYLDVVAPSWSNIKLFSEAAPVIKDIVTKALVQLVDMNIDSEMMHKALEDVVLENKEATVADIEVATFEEFDKLPAVQESNTKKKRAKQLAALNEQLAAIPKEED